MMQNRITCNKCILHSNVPEVEINDDGSCTFCKESISTSKFDLKLSNLLKIKMKSLFEKVIQQNSQYDVLVLFSGGKDSTYLLYLLKNVYKLKPLAVSIIHPLVNENSRKNMETVAERLNVELIKYQLSTRVFTEFIRFGLLNGKKYGFDEFVGCCCCEYFHYLMGFKLAVLMKIPILVDGTSKGQIINKYLDADFIRDSLINKKTFFGIAQTAFEAYSNQTLYEWVMKQSIKVEDLNLNLISPFTFMDYFEKDAYRTIEELGFSRENFLSTRTNCKAVPLFDYINYMLYDCPTYIKYYAKPFRKEFFEIDPIETMEKISPEMIQEERKKMINYLKDYKKLLIELVESGVRGSDINDCLKEKYKSFVEQTKKTLNYDEFNFYFNNAIQINELGDFFGLDLKSINWFEWKSV